MKNHSKWSIIVGNGFTIDAANHTKLIHRYHPSYPWNYKLKNPYNNLENLLSVFPKLNKFINTIEQYEEKTIYEVLKSIVVDSEYKEFYKTHERPTDEDYIHLDACHYFRIAYAWYSQRLDEKKLKNWIWTKWLRQNGENIHTIMSYNYDTILEKTLNLSYLGIIHASTRQNFIFENDIFNPSEPEVYVKRKNHYKKIIHIAKPHGSSNFTGWVNCQTIKDGKVSDLYPFKNGFTVRDGNEIRVLENNILGPTVTADLILPGEWIQWNKKESLKMNWVEHQKRIFIEDSQESNKLLIIGFSFGEPDQEEFKNIFDQIQKFDEIYLVDPTPSNELINYLKKKFSITVHTINPLTQKNEILKIQ